MPANNNASFGLAFRIARRELRGSLSRFRVFLIALTLGVAAIGTVGSIADAMQKGIADNSRRIFGGDMEARATNSEIPAAIADAMEGAGVTTSLINMRAMLGAGEGEGAIRRLVNLKAVDDAWPLLGAPRLDPAIPLADALATDADGRFGIIANPGVLRILGLEVGDTARLGNAEMRVAARLLTEPDQQFGFGALAPRVIISRAGLTATGLDTQGALRTHRMRLLLDDPASRAGVFARLESLRDNSRVRLTEHTNSTGGFDSFITRSETFLTLVSLTALLIGGLGVSSAVRTWLASRMPTLATLKCLGAPARLVFRIYFLQVLILAGLGTATGVGFAIIAPPITSALLENVIAVPIATGIYPVPLLTAAAFGLTVAVAFSLWPLGKARDVNPAQLFRSLIAPPQGRPRGIYIAGIALAAIILSALTLIATRDVTLAVFFAGGVAAAFLLLALLAAAIIRIAQRLPAPASAPMRLALAAITRPGNATGSIVVTFGLGLAVLVAVTLSEYNMAKQLNTRLSEDAPAWYFIDIQQHQRGEFTALTTAAVGGENVDIVPMVRGRIVALGGKAAESFGPEQEDRWIIEGDRALTWANTPPAHNPITRGAWWAEDYKGPLLASMDDEAMRNYGLVLGDKVTMNIAGREMEATIANARRIDWQTFGMNFVFILSGGVIENAPHTLLATVHTNDPVLEARIDREIAAAMPNISAISVREAVDAALRILGLVATAIRMTAGLTLLAGFAVLAGVVAASEARRIHASTILKVLGARRRVIIASYVLEYALLGFITSLVAILIGTLAAWGLMVGYLDVAGFALAPHIAIATGFGGMAATVALGLMGAMRALGTRPGPVLRREAV